MEEAHSRFKHYREVFTRAGLRGDDFSLPRQHSLEHYVDSIRDFGSPNGLCSSITESKHIDAVKRPWRRSSRHNALEQILLVNTRMRKLAAARAEFGRRGMLTSGLMEDAELIAAAREQGVDEEDIDWDAAREIGNDDEEPDDADDDDEPEEDDEHHRDVGAAPEERRSKSEIILAAKRGKY
jgi:hypothetical protein